MIGCEDENLKPPFSNLKSVALILIVAGLIFASGVIAGKTLFVDGNRIESSGGSTANANYGDSSASSGDLGVGSGGLSVSSGNPNVKVWVNTKSGVYHCPNTRWYGNTKHGEYMTQKEAQSKGYRAAHGNKCG